MKNKISAAVVGLGVGYQHLKFYKKYKNCNLVAACDFNEKKLNILKKIYPKLRLYKSFDLMLKKEKLDIVSIASYENYHSKQVIKLLENKINVFVEKPICQTYGELYKIKKALKKNKKIKLSSNFILRNSPQFKKVNEMIRKGTFKNIYYIQGEYNYGRREKIINGWRSEIPLYSVTLGGGLHLIDLAKFFLRKKVLEVNGVGNKIITKKSKFRFYDFTSGTIRFENNIIMNVTSNFGCEIPHHHCLKIFSKSNTFIQDYKSAKIFRSRKNGKYNKLNTNYKNIAKSQILKSFVDSIVFKKKPLVTKSDVLETIAISLAIEKSIKEKKWVKVKY